jgi:hypothetical protein
MRNHRPQLRRSPQASISSQTVQRLFRAGRRKARLLLATRTYASSRICIRSSGPRIRRAPRRAHERFPFAALITATTICSKR